jgi:EpsI family protein
MPLVRPLGEVIPWEIGGYVGSSMAVTEAEAQVAGFSDHLLRVYGDPAADPDADPISAFRFSIYVGYYETQARGHTIHSPKNCLPGAGWEALSSETATIDLRGSGVQVNRYLLQNGPERALVLYWYQGRGRVAHDEYRVKLDLLLDAALRNRSDEALVRVIVPVEDGREDRAMALAEDVATIVIPSLDQALPPLASTNPHPDAE